MVPEINDGILPTAAAEVTADETDDALTTVGVEWLHTTTEGVATGW